MASTRPRGRRRPLLTPELIHEAERVARVGLNDREIIEHLGIGQRTFYQWRQVGDAHRATIQDARGEERSEPVLTERERLCVELVEALARARARGWRKDGVS